ncbi:ATP-binding protein [Streptomyces sp. gb14]|uniref:ATP-binding protein n=1 Tax=Streptomyces sp. gb14 TaxID=1827753 RepID=UPI00118142E8|nr:ATP-binding protein [Streptomyces sp. gb14]
MVSRPASPAAARQEVEFALYTLLCSPDAAVRAAHRAGAQDASWIASELVAHVLIHHTEYSRECLLVCDLSSGGITITVTDSCAGALPHIPGSPVGGRARAGSLFRSVINRVAEQVDVQALPAGGRIISAAIALTEP